MSVIHLLSIAPGKSNEAPLRVDEEIVHAHEPIIDIALTPKATQHNRPSHSALSSIVACYAPEKTTSIKRLGAVVHVPSIARSDRRTDWIEPGERPKLLGRIVVIHGLNLQRIRRQRWAVCCLLEVERLG